MKLMSLIELLRLSRVELCDELARLTNTLPDFPEGSAEDHVIRHNLRVIRRALAQRPADPP